MQEKAEDVSERTWIKEFSTTCLLKRCTIWGMSSEELAKLTNKNFYLYFFPFVLNCGFFIS